MDPKQAVEQFRRAVEKDVRALHDDITLRRVLVSDDVRRLAAAAVRLLDQTK